MNEITIKNLDELKNFAIDFSSKLKSGNVICLKGSLGAGKTTFIKYICEAFKINESVASPTFNILLKYSNDKNININHFDLYRLNSKNELEDINFYEEIESDSISFIEWAEKFEDEMPADAIWLTIEKLDETSLKIF